MGSKFDALVSDIAAIGLEYHSQTLLENARRNARYIQRTVRDIQADLRPCLLVSAGPSLYRERILERVAQRGFSGSVVATDGAYIQCLKAGIVPDYVVTIDPHPTRMVRWFGDPDFERNLNGDDYFARQDLDIAMRSAGAAENQKNIALVDANLTKLAVSCTAAQNVVARTRSFDRYWFAPLVDSPDELGLTRQICHATGLPALNTGGTVGTASWVFAQHILRAARIAVVGMDFGYYLDTPLEKTQSWHMLKGDPEMYPRMRGFWGEHFTDPTYYWYRQNFLDLLEAADAQVTNCSEAGLLYGERVNCMGLDKWLASCS